VVYWISTVPPLLEGAPSNGLTDGLPDESDTGVRAVQTLTIANSSF
jgi:hypothetical protein